MRGAPRSGSIPRRVMRWSRWSLWSNPREPRSVYGQATCRGCSLPWDYGIWRWIRLDVFNLFDSEDFDIAYFFESRLAGEPAEGVSDLHFHPVEPRAVRVTLNYRF